MLSPSRAETGMTCTSSMPSSAVTSRTCSATPRNASSEKSEQVDLVDGHDDVRHAEQRDDGEVTARLLEHALAAVDQHHDGVCRCRAGHHVARVLHVPGAVGEDERPRAGGEVAVGDVDRDALLALGAQAVGEQCEVEVAVREAALRGGAGDLLELVGEDRLRVVQQAADEGRLPVVDRARRWRTGTGSRSPFTNGSCRSSVPRADENRS